MQIIKSTLLSVSKRKIKIMVQIKAIGIKTSIMILFCKNRKRELSNGTDNNLINIIIIWNALMRHKRRSFQFTSMLERIDAVWYHTINYEYNLKVTKRHKVFPYFSINLCKCYQIIQMKTAAAFQLSRCSLYNIWFL
jgi:hypothetical protein